MDWRRLLSTRRLGRETGQTPDHRAPRTEFARDYDRIIFSSAFRRLQDKTQVFPLAKSDYVRTRLTHSLEVASVGRSLGMLAAECVLRREPELEGVVVPQDVGTLMAAACLAHDIGNPPFGHAGEDAIGGWFTRWPGLEALDAWEQADLLAFEGNAQGLRTLCVLQNPGEPGGMQMTCALLATQAKYPCASVARGEGAARHKFGFFRSEAAMFETVAEEVGLLPAPGGGPAWRRHPLAFLVEAADDICYHVIDVEDGFKTGVVDFAALAELHRPFLAPRHLQRAARFPDDARRAGYFRAVTIDRVIRQAVEIFERRYEAIMGGRHDRPLLAEIEQAEDFAAFTALARERIYHARPVVEVNVCGFEVLAGLLEAFLEAVEDRAARGENLSARSRTLLHLLPRPRPDPARMAPYARVQLVTDFVAGMTDSYAVELYQRIRGIALP